MTDVVPQYTFARQGYWAFVRTHTGNTELHVLGDLPAIRPYGDFVVVDGSYMVYSNTGVPAASATTWFRVARDAADIGVGKLDVAGGGGIGYGFYHPLGIPAILEPGSPLMIVFKGDGQVIFGAWGHFVPQPMVAEPQEVTVKGVEFFKKPVKRGPV